MCVCACVFVCVCLYAHVYLCLGRQSGRKKQQCWKEDTRKQEDLGSEVLGASSAFHCFMAEAVLEGGPEILRVERSEGQTCMTFAAHIPGCPPPPAPLPTPFPTLPKPQGHICLFRCTKLSDLVEER